MENLTKEEKDEILTMFSDKSNILSEQSRIAPTTKLRVTAKEEWESTMKLWKKIEEIFRKDEG